MKLSDSDILFVPGRGDSGPDHWQTRWQSKLSTARRVEQADFEHPTPQAWTGALLAEAAASSRPVIVIAHSLGCIVTAMAAPGLANVVGAYLVAPPDVDDPAIEPVLLRAFSPIPRARLPFPSVVVASRNDPRCAIQRASDLAEAWGSEFVDAGDAGHINAAAGYGPWPEGLMHFAGFIAKLKP